MYWHQLQTAYTQKVSNNYLTKVSWLLRYPLHSPGWPYPTGSTKMLTTGGHNLTYSHVPTHATSTAVFNSAVHVVHNPWLSVWPTDAIAGLAFSYRLWHPITDHRFNRSSVNWQSIYNSKVTHLYYIYVIWNVESLVCDNWASYYDTCTKLCRA